MPTMTRSRSQREAEGGNKSQGVNHAEMNSSPSQTEAVDSTFTNGKKVNGEAGRKERKFFKNRCHKKVGMLDELRKTKDRRDDVESEDAGANDVCSAVSRPLQDDEMNRTITNPLRDPYAEMSNKEFRSLMKTLLKDVDLDKKLNVLTRSRSAIAFAEKCVDEPHFLERVMSTTFNHRLGHSALGFQIVLYQLYDCDKDDSGALALCFLTFVLLFKDGEIEYPTKDILCRVYKKEFDHNGYVYQEFLQKWFAPFYTKSRNLISTDLSNILPSNVALETIFNEVETNKASYVRLLDKELLLSMMRQAGGNILLTINQVLQEGNGSKLIKLLKSNFNFWSELLLVGDPLDAALVFNTYDNGVLVDAVQSFISTIRKNLLEQNAESPAFDNVMECASYGIALINRLLTADPRWITNIGQKEGLMRLLLNTSTDPINYNLSREYETISFHSLITIITLIEDSATNRVLLISLLNEECGAGERNSYKAQLIKLFCKSSNLVTETSSNNVLGEENESIVSLERMIFTAQGICCFISVIFGLLVKFENYEETLRSVWFSVVPANTLHIRMLRQRAEEYGKLILLTRLMEVQDGGLTILAASEALKEMLGE